MTPNQPTLRDRIKQRMSLRDRIAARVGSGQAQTGVPDDGSGFTGQAAKGAARASLNIAAGAVSGGPSVIQYLGEAVAGANALPMQILSAGANAIGIPMLGDAYQRTAEAVASKGIDISRAVGRGVAATPIMPAGGLTPPMMAQAPRAIAQSKTLAPSDRAAADLAQMNNGTNFLPQTSAGWGSLTGEQLPALGLGFGAGLVGGPTVGVAITGAAAGAQEYESTLAQLMQQYPGKSMDFYEGEAARKAIQSAAVESVTERLPMGEILEGKLAKMFMGKAMNQWPRWARVLMGQTAKAATSAASEGAEEVVSEGAGAVGDRLAGDPNAFQNLPKRMATAGLIGGAMGAGMGGLTPGGFGTVPPQTPPTDRMGGRGPTQSRTPEITPRTPETTTATPDTSALDEAAALAEQRLNNRAAPVGTPSPADQVASSQPEQDAGAANPGTVPSPTPGSTPGLNPDEAPGLPMRRVDRPAAPRITLDPNARVPEQQPRRFTDRLTVPQRAPEGQRQEKTPTAQGQPGDQAGRTSPPKNEATPTAAVQSPRATSATTREATSAYPSTRPTENPSGQQSSVPSPQSTREPWQMTRAEWVGGGTVGRIKFGDVDQEFVESPQFDTPEEAKAWAASRGIANAQIQSSGKRGGPKLYKASGSTSFHRDAVEAAHAAGKPVPAEVLAEYGLDAKKPEAAREPWQMTRGEYEGGLSPLARQMFGGFQHRNFVLEALALDKPVPAHVVAEYPGIEQRAEEAKANAARADEQTRQNQERIAAEEQQRKTAAERAYQAKVDEHAEAAREHERFMRDEAWKIPKSKYVTYKRGGARQLQEGEHRDSVLAAHAAGKPVPPEVLAEYGIKPNPSESPNSSTQPQGGSRLLGTRNRDTEEMRRARQRVENRKFRAFGRRQVEQQNTARENINHGFSGKAAPAPITRAEAEAATTEDMQRLGQQVVESTFGEPYGKLAHAKLGHHYIRVEAVDYTPVDPTKELYAEHKTKVKQVEIWLAAEWRAQDQRDALLRTLKSAGYKKVTVNANENGMVVQFVPTNDDVISQPQGQDAATTNKEPANGEEEAPQAQVLNEEEDVFERLGREVEDRKKRMGEFIDANRGKPFEVHSTEYGATIAFTPSAKYPGEWQVTWFSPRDGKPSGDTRYPTWDAAVAAENRFGQLKPETAKVIGTAAPAPAQGTGAVSADAAPAKVEDKKPRANEFEGQVYQATKAKRDAWKRLKLVRDQVKAKTKTRLDLLKAESAHREAVQWERQAIEQFNAREAELGRGTTAPAVSDKPKPGDSAKAERQAEIDAIAPDSELDATGTTTTIADIANNVREGKRRYVTARDSQNKRLGASMLESVRKSVVSGMERLREERAKWETRGRATIPQEQTDGTGGSSAGSVGTARVNGQGAGEGQQAQDAGDAAANEEGRGSSQGARGQVTGASDSQLRAARYAAAEAAKQQRKKDATAKGQATKAKYANNPPQFRASDISKRLIQKAQSYPDLILDEMVQWGEDGSLLPISDISTTFVGKLPTELTHEFDAEPQIRSMLRVVPSAGRVVGGNGADWLSKLGVQKYADVLRAKFYRGEGKSSMGVDGALAKLKDFTGQDHGAKFLVWLHDQFKDVGANRPDWTVVKRADLKDGAQFSINGVNFEVMPDEDGNMFLRQRGEDFSTIESGAFFDFDAIDEIPIDAGTLGMRDDTGEVPDIAPAPEVKPAPAKFSDSEGVFGQKTESITGAQRGMFGDISPEPTAEMQDRYPGIRRGETVAEYEKRMGTADTPDMFGGVEDKGDISKAKRGKPKHAIQFRTPIVGPSGAKILSYEWAWTWESVDTEDDTVERRVSDWENAQLNDDTNRLIVHQFSVQQPNGDVRLVSLESALQMLGYMEKSSGKPIRSLASTLKTLAFNRMKLEQLRKVFDVFDAAKKKADALVFNPKEVTTRVEDATLSHLANKGVKRVVWEYRGEEIHWEYWYPNSGRPVESSIRNPSHDIESMGRQWKRSKIKDFIPQNADGITDQDRAQADWKHGQLAVQIRDMEQRNEKLQRKIDTFDGGGGGSGTGGASPGTPFRNTPTINDRAAAALMDWSGRARKRFDDFMGKVQRGELLGSGVPITPLIDLAAHVAFKALASGITSKSGRKLTAFIQGRMESIRAKWPSLNVTTATLRRQVRNMLAAADDDREKIIPAYAAARERAERQRTTATGKESGKPAEVRQAVASATAERPDIAAKIIDAVKRGLKQGRAEGLRTASDALKPLIRQARDAAKRARDMANIEARGAADKATNAAADQAALEKGIRAEAVRLVQETPIAGRRKYLSAVANASKMGDLARILHRLRGDLAKETGRHYALRAERLEQGFRKLDSNRLNAARLLLSNIRAAYAALKDKDTGTAKREELADTIRDHFEQLNSIIHEQRHADKVFMQGRAIQLGEHRDKMLEAVQKQAELPKPENGKEDREPAWLTQKIRKYADFRTLMQMLDRVYDETGIFSRARRAMESRRTAELAKNQEFIDKAEKIVQANGYKSWSDFMARTEGAMGDAGLERIKIDLGAVDSLTVGQAMAIYAQDAETKELMHAGQPWRLNRNGDTFVIDDYKLAELESKLTDGQKRIARQINQLRSDMQFERADGVYKRITGNHMVQVVGHYPRKRILDKSGSENTIDIAKLSMGEWAVQSLENSGFTIKRVQDKKTPLLLEDFGSTQVRSFQGTEMMIQRAEMVKYLKATLFNPTISDAIAQRYGGNMMKRLTQVVAEYSGNSAPESDKWIRKIAANTARSMTQVNPGTWLRNLSTVYRLPLAMLDGKMLGAGAVAAAIPKALLNWRGTLKILMEHSPDLRHRWSHAGAAISMMPTGATSDVDSHFADATKATVRQVIHAAKAWSNPRNAASRLGHVGKGWGALLDSIKVGNAFDAFAAVVAYHAMRSQAPAGLSPNAGNKWAARKAADAFMQTANTNDLLNANEWQTDAKRNTMTALILTFTSDIAKMQNLLYLANKRGGKARALAIGAVASSLAWSVAIRYVLAAALGDDEDKRNADAASTAIQELVSLVPMGSRISPLVEWAINPRGKQPPDILDTPLSSIGDNANGLYRALQAEETQYGEAAYRVFRLLDMAGNPLGPAAGMVRKAIKNYGDE